MKHNILQYIKKQGADIVGVCSFNEETKKLFNKDRFKDNESIRSIIIAGMYLEDPYLDSWTYLDDRDPMSLVNQYLGQICSNACIRLEREGFHSIPLLYSSILLKDAACHAKLGIIGKNNLLVTEDFGPRVRLRALLTDAEFPEDEKVVDNPCDGCDAPCFDACPVNAFSTGKYGRDACYEYASNNKEKISSHTYLWCRECELACTVFSK